MIVLKERTEDIEVIRAIISETLLDAGIKPHHTGFTYLKEEVWILLSESDQCHRAMQLYDCIAKRHNVSCGCVERAVRYAISCAYDHELDILMKFMRFTKPQMPSHFEFVCWTAECIRNKLNS